ncbi:RAVE protein 1 C terminal-domain-containing protein [Chlamydoabsidia padenii]|nr:RAVE protein 1 C terminal-domain-containing protein [Chlamydoabsidia padenii]
MLLEQICPGQVNPDPQSIHVFVCNDMRYIAYASGDKVVLYADPNIFIQILSVQQCPTATESNSVVAITSHAQTNQLAVAYGHSVELFLHDPETQKWKKDSIIDTKNKVTCLDWSIDGQLLVAGEKLMIWEKENSVWKQAWSIKTATSTMLAQFSFGANQFATVGQCDQIVTIWYRAEASNDSCLTYDFVYLSHPRDVTYFTWRSLPVSANGSSDCTLFTMCRDGVGRFWSPTDINVPNRLYMCAVIDPSQSLVTSDSSTSICSSSHHSKSTTTTDDHKHIHHQNDEFSPIHYIGCDVLRNAINVYKLRQASSKHSHYLDHQLDKVKDLIRDTPDLLFRLQPDGSIIFWGVQYLNSWPRRIPKTFVMLRIDQAIAPKDGAFFLQNVNIVHDFAHVQSLSTIKPVELSLLARNPHGELRCYGLNLVDFLDSTSFEPRLRLKYSWVGHQLPITSIHQSHINQFCTVGQDGYINIWKYGLHHDSGQLTTQLLLGSSTQIHNVTLSALVDRDNLLAVYNGKQILLYNAENTGCHLHQYQELPEYDSSAPLSTLFALKIDEHDDNDNQPAASTSIPPPFRSSPSSSSSISSLLDSTRGQSTGSRYLLFGVSAMQHRIFTWEVGNINKDNKLCTTIYRGCQDMQWEMDPTVVSPSNDSWAGGTAAELLYNPGSSLARQNDKSTTPILVVCIHSVVCFYGIRGGVVTYGNNTTVKWEEIYRLDTGLEDILQVCCVGNTAAIVSRSSEMYKLSIWMEIRTNMPPCLVSSFDYVEPIQDVAWYVSSDAQYFLAVACGHKVYIYGQKRATHLDGDADVWILYTSMKIDTEQVISSVAWVDHGALVVTAGNQVRCYQKWLTTDDTDKLALKNEIGAGSLYELSYKLNGSLPLYHPRQLLHYLLWGKVELINMVLLSLLGPIRQMVDGDLETSMEIAPSLPFGKILALQDVTSTKSGNRQQQYNALFDDDDQEQGDTFDSDDNGRSLSKSEARELIDHLKDRRLPGLSAQDQMQLLAMIDTFVEISSQGESLDENGARFTALLENHFHLNKMLPPDQRKPTLESRDIAYALHSQSQDLLLDRCLRLCGGKLLWEDARSLGLFLWLQKIDVVKDQVAAIARNTYLAKEEMKDPVDCSLLYLALRKKSLLQSLWRSASYHKEQRVMVSFLANDFTESRWQRAASKNAFVLLGRQRFEYAAAFFLLADKLKDAVNVILKNLKDYQLAIVVCRVYDGDDSPLLKDILKNYVIPLSIESNDRWLLGTAYWLLGQTHDAIRSIVVPLSQIKLTRETVSIGRSISALNTNTKPENEETDSAAIVNDPTLFILYQHIKNNALQSHKSLGLPAELEYLFSLQVAHSYERIGCPLLSLYVLNRYTRKPTLTENNNLTQSNDTDTTKTNGDVSRAADLFADEDDDIFAPKSPAKRSMAVDLFADDDNDIFAPKSKISDDIFADMDTKATSSTNLFDDDGDDDDDNASKMISTSDIFSSSLVDGQDGDGDNIGDDEELQSYKTLLIVRLLQNVFQSAAAMYHSAPDSDSVNKYRNQFLDNRKALFKLGEKTGLDKSIFSRLLMEKSIESDAFPIYFVILEKCAPDNFNVGYFLKSFQLGCFQIFETILSPKSLNYSIVAFMERWINDMISTFSIWNKLMKTHLPTLNSFNWIPKTCLAAYVCLILVTTKQRHFEKTWTLLYHFSDFMDHIYDDDNVTQAITTIFEELAKDETKMVEMDPEDFESFSDESMFGFDLDEERYKPLQDFSDKSTGAMVLELASLNFVLSTLEQGMHSSKNDPSDPDNLVDFVWATILDPVAYRIHVLHAQIDVDLNHDLTRKNVLRHFKTLRQKRFWHSIKTLLPVGHLLPFAHLLSPEINVLPGESHHPHCNTIYNAGTTVHAFCINLVNELAI